MEQFRDRARSILVGLEEEARPFADVAALLVEAREELDSGSTHQSAASPDARQHTGT